MTAPATPPPTGKVSLVRLAGRTHGSDQDQRFVPLDFVVINPSTLQVQAPANAILAPPGYYTLLLISDDGVPSIAKYVRLIPGPASI